MDVSKINNPNTFKFLPLDKIVETPNLGVSTNSGKSTPIGVIINQYKRMCTIHIRKTCPDFKWQSRYYDRIIRDEKELNGIREYIVNNPLKWEEDDLNTN